MALELPQRALDELVRWQLSVLSGRASLRPIEREALHVTLCFLGELPSEALPALVATCGRLARSSARGLALGHGVWLPRRRPRVLAAALEDDDGELHELQARLSGSLIAANLLKPESRPFFPHVSVARVRSGDRVRPAPLEAPMPVEFAGEQITLFRSHLSGGPARYESLLRVPLLGS